jgi:hypothetical protein
MDEEFRMLHGQMLAMQQTLVKRRAALPIMALVPRPFTGAFFENWF